MNRGAAPVADVVAVEEWGRVEGMRVVGVGKEKLVEDG